MKQAKFVAFLLTTLSAALIFLAATVFLLQGRQTLLARVDDLSQSERALEIRQGQLQQELTNQNLLAAAAEATRAALSAELETTADQLNQAQAEADGLTITLQQTNERLDAAQAYLNAPPEVALIEPADGRIYSPNEPIEITVAANQATAALTVAILVNDEEIGRYESDGRSLLVIHEIWQPPGDGRYKITAQTFGVDGAAGASVSITVDLIDVLGRNAELRALIEERTSLLRELEPLRPVTLTLMTKDELRERLTADFMAETTPDQAADDALVYAAFDFLTADFPLYDFLIELYSEQVAGFYDPETAEFVVISDGTGVMSLSEQWTYAHEFVHALQDQHFDLSRISDDNFNSEQRLALRALAEGEAVLVQIQYLTAYFTQAEIGQILAQLGETDQSILDQAPAILQEGLLFPYDAGFEFVSFLFSQGGWDAINAAWKNPPQSTAHIMHPERYLAGDAPIAVSLPPLTATLGSDWRLLEQEVLGEFYLGQYLRQFLNPREADTAAAGWGGDQYAVYANEANELVMVLRLAWDAPSDAAEFGAAYGRFAARRSGANQQNLFDGRCWTSPNDLICLYESELESLVIRAPNALIMSNVVQTARNN